MLATRRYPPTISRRVTVGRISTVFLFAAFIMPGRFAGAQDTQGAAARPEIHATAQQIVGDFDPDDVDRLETLQETLKGQWPTLVSAAVLAADGDEQSMTAAMRLRDAYVVEISRTDKQVGATSGSSGSTTVTERAGLPWLLAFAIEHGAIQEEKSGTGVTFTTSPYALLTLGSTDDVENYEQYAFWRRWGLAATVPLDQGDTSDDNFDADDVSELSVRFRLIGDRSTRATRNEFLCRILGGGSSLCSSFQERWADTVGEVISERLQAETDLFHSIFPRQAIAIGDQKLAEARDRISALLEQESRRADATEQTKIEGVSNEIKKALDDLALELGTFAKSPQVRTAVARLLNATGDGSRERVAQKALLDEWNAMPLVTLEYTLHRKEIISDYSEVKLLAESGVGPVDLIANAGISFLHDPGDDTASSDVRDYSISLEVQRKINNFLPFRLTQDDQSPIAFSFSGRFARLESEKDEMGIAQAKLVIPITTGVKLPISVTYASRTELIDEDEVRGNFGFTLDTDQLLAAAHVAGLR